MMTARRITCFGASGLLALVAACSDAVPPAAQGAASFHFASPTGPGNCGAGSHWTSSPFDTSTATTQQVTFDNKGPLAIDGQNGAHVACRVVPVGSKFDVRANINTPVPGAQSNTSFFFQTTLADKEMGAIGTVIVADEASGGTGYSAGVQNASPPQGPCLFDSNPNGGVAAGKVWARATCTNAVGVGSPGAACDFTPAGYFVFENCATQ